MIVLREIFSIIVFVVGFIFFGELFINEFSWQSLLVSLFCFGFAYLLWPSRKKGQRQDDHWYLDLIEFVIEVPIELLKWLFRLLGRIFSGKGDGIDLDF